MHKGGEGCGRGRGGEGGSHSLSNTIFTFRQPSRSPTQGQAQGQERQGQLISLYQCKDANDEDISPLGKQAFVSHKTQYKVVSVLSTAHWPIILEQCNEQPTNIYA